jgi:ribA/ribD-fused uncharacterized protein
MTKRNRNHSDIRPLPGKYQQEGRVAIVFSAAQPVFGWLSNMSPSPFDLNGKSWQTVEHFYQAAKSLIPEQSEAIRLADTPFLAKRLGGSRATTLRPNWDNLRTEVMQEAIRAKFTQNEDLRTRLLATGDAILVEGTRDPFWGCGPDGQGLNQLGRLLMQLRAELAS